MMSCVHSGDDDYGDDFGDDDDDFDDEQGLRKHWNNVWGFEAAQHGDNLSRAGQPLLIENKSSFFLQT